MGLIREKEDYKAKYAKGIGDSSYPLPIVGAFLAVGGDAYDTFTGYNAIILNEQCAVSINKSVLAVLPERTAIRTDTTDFEIVFERSIVVLKANFT